MSPKKTEAERRGHDPALEAQRWRMDEEGQIRCVCMQSDRDSFQIH